ncbi:hypothetical protein MUG78_16870 [Gordonia alkaliphila]|uniref:hypothetical protein n=1 Tax=Gordonia alkaliphila TaxID=1053547 RepID=UPI001FF1DFFF|nr:hypothetical protein [Gordonia alkaliphila]MCK0441074.1 hypothetical protein [Gordonia alkaliphila]
MAESSAFRLDHYEGLIWTAERFGERWNGWLTPVVTRSTLEKMFREVEQESGTQLGVLVGDEATFFASPGSSDDDQVIVAADDGLFDLGSLGFMFCAGDS